MEQKLVMAHVFGHADFFKHNVWFQPTDRHMLDRMADDGTRVRRMIDERGQDKVETFLDLALSLDNRVDPFLPLREHMKHRADLSGGRTNVTDSRSASLAEVYDNSGAGTAREHRLPTFDILGFIA